MILKLMTLFELHDSQVFKNQYIIIELFVHRQILKTITIAAWMRIKAVQSRVEEDAPADD